MRKIAGILAALLLIGGSALVPSCIVDDNDTDEGIDAPSVYANEAGTSYTISFIPVDNIQYANVFRQKSSDNFETVTETVNIGQVIPRDSMSNNAPFTFEDPYVGDMSADYRYFIRYWDNTKYRYSRTSDIAPALLNSKDEASLDIEGNLSFLYVRNDYEPERAYTLFLQSDVTLPADFEELHVIIGISGQATKKPFLFAARPSAPASDTGKDETGNTEGDGDAEDTEGNGGEESADVPDDKLVLHINSRASGAEESYTFTGNSEDIPSCTVANLHTVLPAAFRDRPLTLEGVIGVHKIGYKGDDTQIKNKNHTNYCWTRPAKIPNETIQYATRDDSDKGEWNPGEPKKDASGTITQYASKAVETFIVPTIRDPQNDFDYSDARAVTARMISAQITPQLDFTPYRP